MRGRAGRAYPSRSPAARGRTVWIMVAGARVAKARAKVKFQETPNPQAGKFTVGRPLVEGRGVTFDTPEAARGNAAAERLLAEPGVASVFMVADFVTVTKDPAADWAELAPRVQAALREVL